MSRPKDEISPQVHGPIEVCIQILCKSMDLKLRTPGVQLQLFHVCKALRATLQAHSKWRYCSSLRSHLTVLGGCMVWGNYMGLLSQVIPGFNYFPPNLVTL